MASLFSRFARTLPRRSVVAIAVISGIKKFPGFVYNGIMRVLIAGVDQS